MKHHLVNETIGTETREALLDQIRTLTDAMPVMVTIPPGERRRMAKLGLRSRAFAEDAIQLALENTEILPRALDPAVLRAKLDTVENLRDITAALRQLTGRLHETLTVAGAELYEDARLIYTLVKTGMRPGGADHARVELQKRYKPRKSKPAAPAEPTLVPKDGSGPAQGEEEGESYPHAA